MEIQPQYGPSEAEKTREMMDMIDEIVEADGHQLKIAEIIRFYRSSDSKECFVRALATHVVRERTK